MNQNKIAHEDIIKNTIADATHQAWLVEKLNATLESDKLKSEYSDKYIRLTLMHLSEVSFKELIAKTIEILQEAPSTMLKTHDWLNWIFCVSITTGKVTGLVTCAPAKVLPGATKQPRVLRLNDAMGRTCEIDNVKGITKVMGRKPKEGAPGFSLSGDLNAYSPFSMVAEYTPDPQSMTSHPVVTEMTKEEINSALFEYDVQVGQVKYPTYREYLIEHIILLRACKDLSCYSRDKGFYQIMLTQQHDLFRAKKEHDRVLNQPQTNALVGVAEDIIRSMTPARIEAFDNRVMFSLQKRAQVIEQGDVVQIKRNNLKRRLEEMNTTLDPLNW